MAQYEHLPIYKKALDLTVYFEKIVRNFSRYNKYTLGSELWEKSRQIVELIIKANSTKEKLPRVLSDFGAIFQKKLIIPEAVIF